MKFSYSKNFLRNYQKLPKVQQQKADKQLQHLSKNFYHPSLRTKKEQGRENTYEFRVNSHYRMTGEKLNDEFILRTIGPHDKGLGKK